MKLQEVMRNAGEGLFHGYSNERGHWYGNTIEDAALVFDEKSNPWFALIFPKGSSEFVYYAAEDGDWFKVNSTDQWWDDDVRVQAHAEELCNRIRPREGTEALVKEIQRLVDTLRPEGRLRTPEERLMFAIFGERELNMQIWMNLPKSLPQSTRRDIISFLGLVFYHM